jgi:hypothetical protein
MHLIERSPPHPRLAEDSFTPDPDCIMAPARNPFRAQIAFLTDDCIARIQLRLELMRGAQVAPDANILFD